MNKIITFTGAYSFLSNFAPSPFSRFGVKYATVEHFYQSQKTFSKTERQIIISAATPGKAKRLGRKVTIREDWENAKNSYMLRGLRSKFRQNPQLAKDLLATGNLTLVEGNYWHDNEWGNCTCDRCVDIPGKNILGELLMQVREELRSEQ